MKKGFYTALGTPLDLQGNFCPESMARQIELQIDAGVSGLLVMGSMGNMTYLKNSEYPKVAACAVEAAKGRVPVLVGVTDVSIGRVMDRVAALEGINGIDGIVSTIPYYGTCNQANIYEFYNEVATRSGKHTYLYDLAVVTKAPTLPATVKKLWKNPNIKGIKSGNLVTHRLLMRAEDRPADFTQMFSNLDEFDIAYKYGIDKNLDGMFACTPKTAQKMYQALDAGDYALGGKYLDDIIALRNLFLTTPCLMKAFTHAMHLLGCEGNFAQDYNRDIPDADKERVTAAMKALGEI
jgi:4-hydroxy-tetrahydrodipicolinate synthase